MVTLAEFGRTPQINASLGRDHFATAWSATLSGCGVKGGSVFGKTDEKGMKVVDGEVGAAELFRHHLPGRRHQPREELPLRLAPHPPDRAGDGTDLGRAGLIGTELKN